MAKSRFGFYMAHELEDPDNWEGEDYEIEWHEQLKADWWSGTATIEWGRAQYEAEVQGSPGGDGFREIEVVTGLECVDAWPND